MEGNRIFMCIWGNVWIVIIIVDWEVRLGRRKLVRRFLRSLGCVGFIVYRVVTIERG